MFFQFPLSCCFDFEDGNYTTDYDVRFRSRWEEKSFFPTNIFTKIRMLTSLSSRFVRRVATNTRAASTILRIHAREVIDR